MNINYDHKLNPHRAEDSEILLPTLFENGAPVSLLDVGCGTGTWTKAAKDNGVNDILGIDGNTLTEAALIKATEFQLVDLSQPWDLGRCFEMILCLEVAEHLYESYAETLIDSLSRHSERIIFSAACPGQGGQHHVNCQWPEYWQKKFNAVGFACVDSIRPKIWSDQRISPWYRQNMFVATRNHEKSGHEPRIQSMLHPDMFGLAQHCASIQGYQDIIKSGSLPWKWYASVPAKALWSKLKRRFKQ